MEPVRSDTTVDLKALSEKVAWLAERGVANLQEQYDAVVRELERGPPSPTALESASNLQSRVNAAVRWEERMEPVYAADEAFEKDKEKANPRTNNDLFPGHEGIFIFGEEIPEPIDLSLLFHCCEPLSKPKP